jgi:hypothetical protein
MLNNLAPPRPPPLDQPPPGGLNLSPGIPPTNHPGSSQNTLAGSSSQQSTSTPSSRSPSLKDIHIQPIYQTLHETVRRYMTAPYPLVLIALLEFFVIDSFQRLWPIGDHATFPTPAIPTSHRPWCPQAYSHYQPIEPVTSRTTVCRRA